MARISIKAREHARLLKSDETVRLYVEDCTEPYKVQRTLLTRLSEWFEKALSDKFMEGQHLHLRFPETTTATLELFLYWLFEGCLPKEDDQIDSFSTEVACDKYLMYVHLWVFAEIHFLPKLQNDAMLHMYYLRKDRSEYPLLETIRTTYELTAPISIMRKFMMSLVSSGLRTGPGMSQNENGYNGYSIEDVGSLGDIDGFAEDLARGLFVATRLCERPDRIFGTPGDYMLSERMNKK